LVCPSFLLSQWVERNQCHVTSGKETSSKGVTDNGGVMKPKGKLEHSSKLIGYRMVNF
jgi:hypothetical protein